MVNGQWSIVKTIMEHAGIKIDDDEKLKAVIELVKDRCILLLDFVQQASFFFKSPEAIDIAAVQPKWNEQKNLFFIELIRAYELMPFWDHEALEKEFKEIAATNEIKPGDVLLPFRVMLVGGKFGPGVFDIATIIGKDETIHRIKHLVGLLPV
jgi:glutamyl-tRNA synthetase